MSERRFKVPSAFENVASCGTDFVEAACVPVVERAVWCFSLLTGAVVIRVRVLKLRVTQTKAILLLATALPQKSDFEAGAF